MSCNKSGQRQHRHEVVLSRPASITRKFGLYAAVAFSGRVFILYQMLTYVRGLAIDNVKCSLEVSTRRRCRHVHHAAFARLDMNEHELGSVVACSGAVCKFLCLDLQHRHSCLPTHVAYVVSLNTSRLSLTCSYL